PAASTRGASAGGASAAGASASFLASWALSDGAGRRTTQARTYARSRPSDQDRPARFFDHRATLAIDETSLNGDAPGSLAGPTGANTRCTGKFRGAGPGRAWRPRTPRDLGRTNAPDGSNMGRSPQRVNCPSAQ